MSNAVDSRYEIKARLLAYEQRQSEMRLKGASDKFLAASERVADRESLFSAAKARASKPRGDNPLLALDRMHTTEKLIKAAKKKLNESMTELRSASEVRDSCLKQVGELKNKGEFLADKIHVAELRQTAKVENSQSEALVELASLKPVDKKLEIASETEISKEANLELAGDDDAISELSTVSPTQQLFQPDLQISPVQSDIITNSNSGSSELHSGSNGQQQNPTQNEAPKLDVWEDKGVVTAKFDVGESYKVELSAEGAGPVSVFIAPQNGLQISAATVTRIKEQLKAKNISYSSIVVGKGAK